MFGFFWFFLVFFGFSRLSENSAATLAPLNFQIAPTTCTQAHTEKQQNRKTQFRFRFFFLFFGSSRLWENSAATLGTLIFQIAPTTCTQARTEKLKNKQTRVASMEDDLRARKTRASIGFGGTVISNSLLFFGSSSTNMSTKTATRSGEKR